MTLKRRWIIGSAVDCDVIVTHPTVAPHHGLLVQTTRGFLIEDLGSANGIFVNDVRVDYRARVTPADRITLGREVAMPWPAPAAVPDADVLRIGRAPDNDVVLDYPVISPYHARVIRKGGRAWIEDLNSIHGIALGHPGRKVSRSPLTHTDLVYLGWLPVPASRILTPPRRPRTSPLPARSPQAPGEIVIRARDVCVQAAGRHLLQDVSLTIFPGELVAIMGPSGAGKTTLLRTLNGYTRPSSGEVLYNGKNLHAHYRRLSGRLGYVPQDDILHHELTVRQVLTYGARLRLPAGCSSADLDERLDEVIHQLGLEGTEDVRIGSPEQPGISGGQRKRVNLALELLTDPLVLLLDEPTSGLSSEEAMSVLRLLRELADAGKTIILTLHQPSPEAFRLLDNLALLGRDAHSARPGRVVYYGPAAPDAIRFFTEELAEADPNAMLRGLAARSTEEWASRYAASPYRREYVVERARRQPLPPLPEATAQTANTPAQWWTLVRRALAIKMQTPLHTAILLAQAPLIALLIVLVYGKQTGAAITPENWPDVSYSVAVALFLQLLAALWFGCSNAVREIVGEWAVYQRERMVGLKIPCYVAAKLTVLGGLCLLQCAVLLGIVHAGCGLKGPWLTLFAFVLLAALVGVVLGLAISALVRTASASVSLLPILLLLVVILGGAMQPVHRMTDAAHVLCQAVPSRWAFEGMLLVESEHQPVYKPSASTLPAACSIPSQSLPTRDMAEYYFPASEHRSSPAVSAAALAALLLLPLAALLIILRLRDVC